MAKNNKWQALPLKDRAFLIREAVRNGITDINSIRDTWEHRFDGLRDVVEKVNTSDKDFAIRLRKEGRASIPDWEDSRKIATHKLGVSTDENGIHYIFPEVQNINGQLVDFTNPNTKGSGYGDVIAAERGDTIQIGNTSRDLINAIKFTEKYKKLGIYPEFSEPPHTFSGEEDTGILDVISSLFTTKKPIDNRKTAGPVDLDEIRIRQAWAESKYDDNAKSRAGARGRFQIMPAVQADYIKAGGKKGNLHNAKYNTQVRDWYMDNLSGRTWITKGNATDSVKMGKQLAAYNAGPTKVLNALQRAKNDGVDIYDSFDWVSTKYLKPETVDYVNWILRNKTTGSHRNDTIYQENKHKYKK